MKYRSHQEQAQAERLCAELREDDGIPPSILAKRKQQEHRHINYHGEQLCKQIRIALGEALICDCADPAFADLQVIEVSMASGTAALEVVVTAPDQDANLLREIQQHLQKAEGLLRAAIGPAINRKRLPHLKFRLLPT